MSKKKMESWSDSDIERFIELRVIHELKPKTLVKELKRTERALAAMQYRWKTGRLDRLVKNVMDRHPKSSTSVIRMLRDCLLPEIEDYCRKKYKSGKDAAFDEMRAMDFKILPKGHKLVVRSNRFLGNSEDWFMGLIEDLATKKAGIIQDGSFEIDKQGFMYNEDLRNKYKISLKSTVSADSESSLRKYWTELLSLCKKVPEPEPEPEPPEPEPEPEPEPKPEEEEEEPEPEPEDEEDEEPPEPKPEPEDEEDEELEPEEPEPEDEEDEEPPEPKPEPEPEDEEEDEEEPEPEEDEEEEDEEEDEEEPEPEKLKPDKSTPDEYSPEGNVDPSGVGTDPACGTVYKLLESDDKTPPGSNIDRMKRTKAFASVRRGIDDPYTVYNREEKFEKLPDYAKDRYPFGRKIWECPKCKEKMGWDSGHNVMSNGSWSWECKKCGKKTPHTVEIPLYSNAIGYWVVGNKRMVFEGNYEIKGKDAEKFSLGHRVSIPTPCPGTILLIGHQVLDNDKGTSVNVVWEKDSLDNWYMRQVKAGAVSKAIIKWKVSCPLLKDNYWLSIKDRFSTTLPISGWDRDALASDMGDLAQQLLDILGLSPKNSAFLNIDNLGRHCSSFSCGNIPEGDIILESFKAKQGACRNRALDFFVAALKLGINCRYVISDCHAFVELWEPKERVWIALDLGGCDPGGPRNPSDMNPPQPEKPKPDKPGEELPPEPERPDERARLDIRKIWRDGGMSEEDIARAFQAWKKSGGMG